MPFLGILFLVGLGAAIKGTWDHAWDARQKSRSARVQHAQGASGKPLPAGKRRSVSVQHDAAWWVWELLRGSGVVAGDRGDVTDTLDLGQHP